MPNPPNEGTGQLISPFDQRVYDIPSAKHEEYKQAGWITPTAEADEGEVHSHINNWREMGGVESAIYSASHGFLGLPWLVEKGSAALGHEDWARDYADSVQLAEQQHPYIDTAARLTAGIGSAALYTAGAVAAAPALGLGALGVGAAEAGGAAALGAEGASALAGAAGISEGAVAAGEAVLGAGEAGGGALNTLSSYGKLAARFGAEGAAIGVVNRYDQAAILHAASPEGQEKVVWSVSDIAQDAALNAVLGVGLVGGIKTLAKLGRVLEGRSTDAMADSLLNRVSAEQVALQGRGGELRRMAKEIIPLGVERGRVHVDNLVDIAEKDMNQLKYEIAGKGNWLNQKEVQSVKDLVEQHVGGTAEGAKILKMIEDASGETELAKTFAPGDMARRADAAANAESKAAREKYISDYDNEYKSRLEGHKDTEAYAKHQENVSKEQARLNAEDAAEHGQRTAIYESQQKQFLKPDGGRYSPAEWKVRFGKDVPGHYYEPAPVARGPKTAHVPFEPVVKEMPFEPPSVSELKPGEQYQAMNDSYFASLEKGDPKNVMNPQALQDIRKNIYDMINFNNFGGRPLDTKLRDLGHAFGDEIKGLFTRADSSLGKQYAADWARKDELYSGALLLKSALRKGGDGLSLKGLLDKVVSAGLIGAAVGSTGFMGGPIAAGKASASFKAIQSVKAEHFVAFGRAMGHVVGQADVKLAKVLTSKLRNTPVLVRNYYSPGEYTQLAAKLSKIGQDPTAAASNINQALSTAGLPENMALDLTGKLHAQNMYLVNQLVHNTGPADMPTLAHGDPVKLRKVVGQAKTMANPTHGLDNPTAANLEVLKKFYPQTLLTAQTAVYEQIRKNPRMSPQTKQWASRILGRPINNLSSPRFSTMLAQSRAASQQAAQAAGGSSKGPKRSSGGDDVGAQTRLDELQGGN